MINDTGTTWHCEKLTLNTDIQLTQNNKMDQTREAK